MGLSDLPPEAELRRRGRVVGFSPIEIEQNIWKEGFGSIAGIDEVGVGCLAGPVVAAAVVLDPRRIPEGITDSKKLNAVSRERVGQSIRELALGWSIGSASVEEIDTINIFHAAKRAMERAVLGLGVQPDFLLIDGKFGIQTTVPFRCVVQGDLKSASIGAASILAKVHRDEWMRRLDDEFPGYGFAKNKGYGSIEHRKGLGRLGPSLSHRKSFSWKPV